MNKTLRVGVIGAGNIATTVHLPLLACMGDIQVSYVADIALPRFIFPKGIQKIQLDDDPSILPDCDMAFITVPVGVREMYVREFAKRGIPIFAEKPFAVDTSMHQRFLQGTRVIGCNYMRTCYSSVQQLRTIIASKLFGELRSISVCEGSIAGKTKKQAKHYQTDIALSGGGILMESGCHTLSQIDALLAGARFKVVDAAAIYQDGFDVDVQVNLRAALGSKSVPITYHISLVKSIGISSRYTFEEATITFNHNNPKAALQIKNQAGAAFSLEQDKRLATMFYQAFYLRWRHFIQGVLNSERLDPVRETSMNTTEIISEIYTRTR